MKTQTKEITSLILFMLGIIGISALLIHIIGVWLFFGGMILLYGCWELYLEGQRIKQKKFYNEAYFRNLAIEDAAVEQRVFALAEDWVEMVNIKIVMDEIEFMEQTMIYMTDK